jgi:hypothetical protein
LIGAVPTLAPSLWSRLVGVGHEEQPLSLVRSADACSRQIRRCAGVASSFQVSEYKIEPRPAKFARNLLSKDDCRATLRDEMEPHGPEMAFVVESATAPGIAEPLAGARAGPHVGVVGDASEPEREAPSGDAGEEMPLPQSSNVSWSQIGDASLIDNSRRDVAGCDQAAQPSHRERIDLVVQRGHSPASLPSRISRSRLRIPVSPQSSARSALI